MSKSLGNHIGVSEAPEEQFGRTMRIPDDDPRRVVPAAGPGRAAPRRATRPRTSAGWPP